MRALPALSPLHRRKRKCKHCHRVHLLPRERVRPAAAEQLCCLPALLPLLVLSGLMLTMTQISMTMTITMTRCWAMTTLAAPWQPKMQR